MYTPTGKSGVAIVTNSSQPKNQRRTAIIYFGFKRETYLELVKAEDSSEFLRVEKHKPNCCDRSRYTGRVLRERSVQGWVGERVTVPICRVRCCRCGAVFTVLPSFILRYRRQDSDCLSKLLPLSMSMGLSQRHT